MIINKSEKMRKVAIYCILSLVSFLSTIPAAAGVVERLYISTDKDSYIAGDRVWCSLFLFSAGEKFDLSNFSSTAYLELQDKDKVVLTAKVALVEGRGAGAIELPPTLPTGNYRLVGYTTQNRNELGFVPEGKVISIYNVITTERVEGNVDLTQEDLFLSAPAQEDISPFGPVSVEAPSGAILAGKEFTLKVTNWLMDDISFSLSVYHKDPFVYNHGNSLANFKDKVTHSSYGEVVRKYTPDYEGEVMTLRVGDKVDDFVLVSFPGDEVNTFASKLGDDGLAKVVTANVYGDRDMVCEGGTAINLVDPFIRQVVGDIPKLRLFPSMKSELERRGISMQLSKRFHSDTLFERLPVRQMPLLDMDRKVYRLDDYTRFPTMEEVLIEFVSEVRVRTVKKEKELSILIDGPAGPTFSSNHSLVLLDGVPVTDQSKILDMDPLLVHRIEIYDNIYSIGNVYFEGIANFITYKGDMAGFEFGDDVKILPYKGALYPMAYTGSSIKEGDPFPDYRETIYWHPLMEMGGDESKEIRCIAPLYGGKFEIILEGVTSEGEVVHYKGQLDILSPKGEAVEDYSYLQSIQPKKQAEPVKNNVNKAVPVAVAVPKEKPAPAAVPAAVPVAAPVAVPVVAPVQAPGEEPSSKTVSEPVVKPASAPVVEPVPASAEKPVPVKVKKSKQKSAKKSQNSELPYKKVNEGELKEGVKYKSIMEIR